MTIFTEEQIMLRDMAKSWVQERAPVSALRACRKEFVATGYDPALYREMAEMGWTGIIVPEAFGGSDFGVTSMGLVLAEMGRNLVAAPLLSTALLAATLLRLGGTDAQKAQYLPAIVEGRISFALALDEGTRHDPAATTLRATRQGDGWRLNGRKHHVLDSAADMLIVVARTSGQAGDAQGLSLFLVDRNAAGIRATALQQLDSHAAANMEFSDVAVSAEQLLGSLDSGMDILEPALDVARAGLAAEMLGAAEQAFATTVDYLKIRVQFDKPIGSFQALQHRAAGLIGELELTRSAVYAALAAIDQRANDVPLKVSVAKVMAGKTFRHMAQEMIQMHGGIGMTDEHDAGLYLKRAHACDHAFGTVAYHRERYARIKSI